MNSNFIKDVFQQIGYILGREIDYRRIKPRDALFFITYRCTSHCKTCSMWQRGKEGDELSLEDWKRAADMCHEMGVKYIELFGGDALLRKDVVIPLVAHIKSRGIEVDLTTNCNLLDEETAEGLVGAGLDDLWLSIDGVGATHDSVRGKDGFFGNVLKCIEAVKRARGEKKTPLLHCNTTISKLNVDAFGKVLPFARDAGLDFLHLEYAGEFLPKEIDQAEINGVKPTPYFISKGDSILVDPIQARTLKRTTRELKKEARSMKFCLRTENIDCLNIRNLITGEFGNRKCYIARFKVTIDPYGNILPCPFFSEYHLGNIKKDEIRQIWKNDMHLTFLENLGGIWPVFCKRCILGVQRNRTPWRLLQDATHRLWEKSRK